MKLNQYIKMLQKIVKENPEAKNYLVVSAGDEEGNNYMEVFFAPTLGQLYEGDFYSESDAAFFKEEHGKDFKENAICIN